MSVDSDVQTAAAITDEELCAGLQAHVSTAGDGESDGEPADTNDSQPDAAAVTLAVALQSMNNVRAYLEAAGCSSYELFHGLQDQVYATGRQQVVQKNNKTFLPAAVTT